MTFSEKLKDSFNSIGLEVEVKEIDENDVSVLLSIKVNPASKLSKIAIKNKELVVHLTQKAHDGEANEGLVNTLGKTFGLPKSSVFIDKGHRARSKKVILNYIVTPNKKTGFFCQKIARLRVA